MDLSLIFSEFGKGFWILFAILYTLVLWLGIGLSKRFKSAIIENGTTAFFVSAIVWFLGGGMYADLWRISYWGTANGRHPLPEFFDASAWGFAVAAVLFFAFLFWLIRATRVRTKNPGINFDV